MPDFNVEEVLKELTLDEKIGLISGVDAWHTFPVPRLDIPSLRFSDGPNGIRGTKNFDTIPGAVLPNGTALASTWDKKLFEEAGVLIGIESHHKSAHVALGPTSNIQRGPNGGRGFESFSEDPYLSGIAAAYNIKGIQSKHVGATMKHFVGNDQEDERKASNSIITERALREIYLEPFRLALKYGNPIATMSAYNKVNGEHVSQSKKFLIDILRTEWGFEGTVMSDWVGTYTGKNSIEGGLDIEMPGTAVMRTKEQISGKIQSKELHINHLNDRVRGVLKLIKYAKESGIPERGPEDTTNNTPETSALLRKLAAESIVLLKNDNGVLPLKKEDTIAVIGPNAKYAAYSGGGSATLTPYYTVTPFEGISNKLGFEPPYALGAHGHIFLPGLATQVKNPVTGETGMYAAFYHEPRGSVKRTMFDEFKNITASRNPLIGYRPKAVKNVDDMIYGEFEGIFTPDETGVYEFGIGVIGTALLYIDDQLLVDNKTNQRPGPTSGGYGTVEETGKIHLEKGKDYRVLIEFGSRTTSKLNIKPSAFTKSFGAISFGCTRVIDAQKEIYRACEIAKSVTKPILCIGTNGEWETEGFDRSNLDLPGYTNDLVSAVLKANPNAVIVNQSGTPCEFPWIKDAKAVVQAWFGGNELGNGIADVLFGDVNPAGKLPLTFPKKIQDNPAYLNFKTERGRVFYGEDIFVGYRYYEKLQRQVMFPFGYGLSYTTFKFSGLGVSVDETSGKISVSVDVENTGTVNGKEVIQVYISKTETDVIRPVKELKGFDKVSLKAGEKKAVSIEICLKESISYFDEWENKWHAQEGQYTVQVGSSSDDIELIGNFEVVKGFYWLGL